MTLLFSRHESFGNVCEIRTKIGPVQAEKGTFVQRTDRLANDLGLSLRELAPKLGMSVSSLFAYRSETRPVSRKAWKKLTDAEAGTSSESVQETRPLERYGGVVAPNRGHSPPPENPTRADCLARLDTVLDLAEQFPGGLGLVYSDLSLSLVEIRRRLNAHEESDTP